ncbi:AAA family ATPase [Paraburkholderia sp. Se-20369]|nr:AAA family ATPase [Paraburkholderia sp. Se-20369]
MIESPTIENIRIEKLHDQFDVDLSLKPGLNIIYGKNGRGKTTILHAIANILELDFRRFLYIRFSRIQLKTHDHTLSIEKIKEAGEESISIELNGQRTSRVTHETDISPAEKELLRSVIGPRSVYLPAFRAVIESAQRARDNYRFYAETMATDDYKSVLAVERAGRISEQKIVSSPDRYRIDRSVEAVALKTVQCREWFGKFVPMIRYPSLGEVEESLCDEWSSAHLQLARSESRMFSEVFARVFESIVDDQSTAPDKEIRGLLNDLSTTITKLDLSGNTSPKVYARISEAVNHSLGAFGREEETAKRVLSLYVDFLKDRVAAQKTTFEDIRAFEQSVNFFLDPKSLYLETVGATNRRPRALVKSQSGNRSYRISSLSSGERQVLTMLFCASRMSANYGIFLIDEPELSLHVDWQRCILSELTRQAGARQIIACTHSPEVGADHPDGVQLFEPNDSADEEQGFNIDETDDNEGA